jgi:tellurite resistance protein TehA-like permease
MDRATDAAASDQPARAPAMGPPYSLADLPTNLFAIVMATGIVSISANGESWRPVALALFWLNAALYFLLGCLVALRCIRFPDRVLADYASHAKAPGYFTLVAGSCALGKQCILVAAWPPGGMALWVLAFALWCLFNYTLLPGLMSVEHKPRIEQAISGTWLLAVVGTQSVSILATMSVPSLASSLHAPALLIALGFWLVGSMLYIWLISLIFYRLMFLPLSPAELTPPYWVNMGAMAISTLGGLWLIHSADRLPLLADLLPFLKGMTLLFWCTAAWWIPLLAALGVWRHIWRHVPFTYDHGYWAAVFPLGMFAVATQRLSNELQLPFLRPVGTAFAALSLAAWAVTFVGFLLAILRSPGWRFGAASGHRIG